MVALQSVTEWYLIGTGACLQLPSVLLGTAANLSRTLLKAQTSNRVQRMSTASPTESLAV